MKRYAFTLSEVLITLVIIGVIAAVTLTSLINDTNNKQYISAYMKMYSSICQVYDKIKFDNGGSITDIFDSVDEYTEVFQKYLIGSKICKAGNTYGECWHKKWYTIKGSQSSSTENSFSSLILNDGSIILFLHMNSSCTGTTEINTGNGCARLRTDVNGFKGPNRVGRDIFDFYILENKVIARGDPSSTTDINNSAGWGKGYKILTTGEL